MDALKRFIKSAEKKERYAIPKTVQDAIPIQGIWKDGVFQSGKIFSKCYRFADINYQTAGADDQSRLFLNYSGLLNSLESDRLVQITINNHRRNAAEFAQNVLFPMQQDDLDVYRKEYNQMLRERAQEDNGIVQEKYITVTSQHKDVKAARNYFFRVSDELDQKLLELGSHSTPLNCTERLQILHNFYRSGEEDNDTFDLREFMRLGRDFRDYICPDCIEKRPDYLRLGKQYCRVLFFKSFSTYINDEMIKNLCDLDRNMMLTITVMPIAMEEALRLARNKLTGVETNITNWQNNQNRHNNFSAVVPYDMELQREECREFLNDLSTRDQRVFNSAITLVHMADSLEQLNEDTERLYNIAQKKMCQLAPLSFQQLDGLNSTLPFGLNRISAAYTMTTESLSAFIPFNARDVLHPHGVYYGQNAASGNMIFADRLQLLNGNSLILGCTGSGKSMIAKNEIISLMLNTDADIIIIDPEHEYSRLVSAFHGEIIRISETSGNHINAMDIRRAHDETMEQTLRNKQAFILSLCEEIIGEDCVGPMEKSLIDRCTGNIYRRYLKNNQQDTPPTLADLYQELMEQPETLGKEIAVSLELYAKGSMNTFAQQTNVNTSNRLICFDIYEIGKDLMSVAMLVILDNIMNRISQNRRDGKKTFIFIDEIYLLFLHKYSFEFLYKLWKRIRKYGGCCTGLTQNVEDVLQSDKARSLISNSEFLALLNQSPTDRPILANMLHIPNTLLSHITNSKPGHGILKIGKSLIPFTNEFSKDTKLYQLITTKQDEIVRQEKQTG